MKRARWPEAAEAVRDLVRSGKLRPGDLTPTATELSVMTGVSAQTCRKAVLMMARKGELVPAPSPAGRPRVPGGDCPGPAELALSGALIGARKALRLSQAQLAEAAGLSVTAVHHAETGRFREQSARAWALLDRATLSGGRLVRMHAAWQAGLPAGSGS